MPAPSASATSGGFLARLSVPYKDRLLVLPVEHILSVEVHDGITRLYTLGPEAGATVRQHLVSHTLDHFEAHLDPAQFQRVHRSAIVQVNQIREMVQWFSGRYKLVMNGSHEVIASRDRSRALRDQLML